jgi:pyruvate/2-oxoglutarate dehydrogenase complex dihydrolipoamide dehydrogenase (E3) component
MTAQTQIEDFDIVLLGGGTGGTVAAWTFASEGKRVAVIDRKYIGGSCPNIACLPSKNVIQAAKVASFFRRGREFGILTANGGPAIDMRLVRERKRKMVFNLNADYLENYKNTGAELLLGAGRFIAPRTIEVTLSDGKTRQLRGKNVIVNTGTRASFEPIPGLVESQPLTHIEALELAELPEHLIVLGSGYVGLEFAQAMRRFGSKVTVIGRMSRVLHNEDEDVSTALQQLFADEGIDLILNAKVKSVTGKSGETVRILLEINGAQKNIEGTHLLIATGRTPNTNDIGLDLAGVELTPNGFIKTDEHLATTAPGVYALGEVAGSPFFTHISIDDFRIIHSSISGDGKRVTVGRVVPFCLFTDPELAHYGLREREVQAQNIPYRLFRIPMAAVLRAKTVSETRGFLKCIVAADSDRILGFTAFGASAAEIMTAVQIAMSANLPYTALRDTILTHPTWVEGLAPLFTSAATSKPAATQNSAAASSKSAAT